MSSISSETDEFSPVNESGDKMEINESRETENDESGTSTDDDEVYFAHFKICIVFLAASCIQRRITTKAWHQHTAAQEESDNLQKGSILHWKENKIKVPILGRNTPKAGSVQKETRLAEHTHREVFPRSQL